MSEILRVATAAETGGLPNHDWILCLQDGSSIGMMSPGYPGEAELITSARARRLVACWNSCLGISTESLERIKFDPPSFTGVANPEPRFLVQMRKASSDRREILGLSELLGAANHIPDESLSKWLPLAEIGDGRQQQGMSGPYEIWRVS